MTVNDWLTGVKSLQLGSRTGSLGSLLIDSASSSSSGSGGVLAYEPEFLAKPDIRDTAKLATAVNRLVFHALAAGVATVQAHRHAFAAGFKMPPPPSPTSSPGSSPAASSAPAAGSARPRAPSYPVPTSADDLLAMPAMAMAWRLAMEPVFDKALDFEDAARSAIKAWGDDFRALGLFTSARDCTWGREVGDAALLYARTIARMAAWCLVANVDLKLVAPPTVETPTGQFATPAVRIPTGTDRPSRVEVVEVGVPRHVLLPSRDVAGVVPIGVMLVTRDSGTGYGRLVASTAEVCAAFGVAGGGGVEPHPDVDAFKPCALALQQHNSAYPMLPRPIGY